MNDNSNSDGGLSPTIQQWFALDEEAADVLPSERLNLITRYISNFGPHGTPATWSRFVREVRKAEPHKFFVPPYSAEELRESLRKLRPAAKLELIARFKRSGKK